MTGRIVQPFASAEPEELFTVTTVYDDLEVTGDPIPWREVARKLSAAPAYSVTEIRVNRAGEAEVPA